MKRTLLRALPFVIGLGVLTTLWLPTLWYPFGRDQAFFAVVGEIITHGGAPYRDAFELKPPGIHWLYGLTLAIWRDMRAIRVMELVLLSATLVCAMLLFPHRRRWVLAPLTATALGLVQFHLFIFWHFANPDTFMALPIALGLALQMRIAPRRPGPAAVLVGACIGAAFWFKFTGILIAPLFLWLIAQRWRRRANRRVLHLLWHFALVGVGFLIPAAVILGHLAMHSALWDFWQIFTVALPAYARSQAHAPEDIVILGYNLSLASRGLWQFISLDPLIVAAPLALFTVGLIRRRMPRSVVWGAAALSLPMVLAQGKFWHYHWSPLALWLCVLTAMAAEWPVRWLFARRRWHSHVWRNVIALTFGIALVIGLTRASFLWPNRVEFLRTWWAYVQAGEPEDHEFMDFFGTPGVADFSHISDVQVARHVDSITQPGERIFIWGFEPSVYFLSNRPPATRFLFIMPLVAPFSLPEWRAEVMSDLQSNPPAVFLVVREDHLGFFRQVGGDSAQLLDRLYPDLRDWLERHCVLDREIEHFAIWRLRESPADL